MDHPHPRVEDTDAAAPSLPSAPTSESTLSSNFSGLQTELKLEVLRHRLLYHKPINAIYHSILSRRLLLPLARVNKELRELAFTVYYEENTFVVHNNIDSSAGLIPGTSLVASPRPSIRPWIRKLEIHLDVDAKIDLLETPGAGEIYRASSNGWHFLLSKPDVTSPFTKWQHGFTKLATLKVVLNFCNGGGSLRCLSDRLKSTVQGVEMTEIVLRADVVSSRSASIAGRQRL